MPLRTRSSPPTPTSRPSTAAGARTTSSDDEEDYDDERRHGYELTTSRRPRDPYLTLDEGGGACVVVVAPGPMAAAAAAASKRQNRRRRPPTPVGGDGFPSVGDELRTCTVASLSAAAAVGVPYAETSCGVAGRSSSSCSSRSTVFDADDVGPEHRGPRSADDASHDRRSVTSSRTNSGEPAPRRFRHSKLGARLMLAVLGGSSVVLLGLLLAYNTQLEQNIIHRVKSVFDKGQGKRQARADANATHYTGVTGSVDEAAPRDPHRGSSSTTTTEPSTLPESAEEFEQRLRQMVSHFWTPRDDNDYVGRGGFGFDPPRAIATRRGWPEGGQGDDVDTGAAARPPVPEGGGVNEPTEPLSQPLVRDALHRRTDWFLVQARRSHGRLPDANWAGDGKSGNASGDGVVEIEQLWHEGDDADEDDGARGVR